MTELSKAWAESNQRYLVASIEGVRAILKEHIARQGGLAAENLDRAEPPEWTEKSPPALSALCELFGLSEFEKSVLLLCAAVELDSETAQLCAKAQRSPSRVQPTFGLALGILPGAHWSALAPSSPLRRFKLVELCSPSTLVTAAPLRIEERVLHYLTGVSYLDPQLRGTMENVGETGALVASHMLLVERIILSFHRSHSRLPVVQLWGIDETSKLAIAQEVCGRMGLGLMRLPDEFLPVKHDEIDAFIQLWTREGALLESGLFISAEGVELGAEKAVKKLLDSISGPTFLGARDQWTLPTLALVSFEVKKPEKEEQLLLWKSCLGQGFDRLRVQEVSKLVGQFDLNSKTIQAAAREAQLSVNDGSDPYDALWKSCRALCAPRLAELAQRIVTRARMDDLVLPDREKQLLREIVVHAEQRNKVYIEWGFEKKSSRGLGITVLFSGVSGAGKTMAAEVLANELDLDLFRIDLATVVSKYIGETEKNLRRVFDAAEDGGAILFFDEADALFGKRSEVQDSHDRYANIEIGYLLQRMESYHGLAILATNMKSALDPAFTRRIKFMVDFPFPDERSRAEIWRHVFPPEAQTDDLEIERLARLNITGGNIRNIALYASFLAAGEGVPVNMNHLKRAAQVEYGKLERPLTQVELGGWQ